MRLVLIILFLLCFGVSNGQKFTFPSIQPKGNDFSGFVPAGWTTLDSASGDLNKDGRNDAAIILQHKDSVILLNSLGNTILTQPRILLILFKNPADNSYQLMEQSNTFILKHDNPAMEDPYVSIAINKGILETRFQFFYNMGSWFVINATYKFRYQQGQFALIGADKVAFHRATHDFEEYSYNFLTKKRSLTKGNDSKGTKKRTWKTINITTLPTLKTFTEPFTWEVEKDVYL